MHDQEDDEFEQVTLSPEFSAVAAVEALHDSPARSANAPRCFPGTHLAGKQRLSNWLDVQSQSHNNQARGLSLLWVHGPAGVGKTTLMQSCADALLPSGSSPDAPPSYESDKFITGTVRYGGAAFFFSRENQITDPKTFFITLAYGLACRLPPLAPFIQSAFESAPEIVDMPLDVQCDFLILNPIQAWATAEDGDLDIDLAMIVDGLDECSSKEAQVDIVEIICSMFLREFPGVRWLWIISTRTEALLHSLLTSVPANPRASEVIIPLASDEEMTAYLKEAFARIRESHPTFQGLEPSTDIPPDPSLRPPEEWPSEADLVAVRWQAAGVYATAASMLEYVANPGADPRARLRLVDDFTGHSERFPGGIDHPYSKLDALYHSILSKVPESSQSVTKRILGAISCTQPSSHEASAPTAFDLAELLGITVIQLCKALYDLHSLVCAPFRTPGSGPSLPFIAKRDKGLTFYHRSFDHFLRTPARSLDWGLELEAIHLDLAKGCLRKLSSNYLGLSSKIPKQRWFIHCWRTGEGTEAAFSLLPELCEFDYSVLSSNATVDRYFVEWLLRLQDTAKPERQLLSMGPPIELDASAEAPNAEQGTSTRLNRENKKLPARKSYMLGLEPAKQVYLVPFYDVKVQWRKDLGQAIGPREKHWDWIRSFKVVQRDWDVMMEHNESSATASTGTSNEAVAGLKEESDGLEYA